MQLSWEIQGSGRLSDSFKVTEILFLKKGCHCLKMKKLVEISTRNQWNQFQTIYQSKKLKDFRRIIKKIFFFIWGKKATINPREFFKTCMKKSWSNHEVN